MPAPPERHPELASTSPYYLLLLFFLFFFGGGGGSMAPAIEAGAGAGAGAAASEAVLPWPIESLDCNIE